MLGARFRLWALRKYSFRTSQGFPSLWFRELAITFVIAWFSGTESIPSRAVTQPFNQTNGVLDRWVNKKNRAFLGLWGNSRVCDPFYNVLANRNWSELRPPPSKLIREFFVPPPSQFFSLFLGGGYISLVKLYMWDFEKCFRMKCYLSIQNTIRRFICCLPVPPTLLTSLLPNTFFFSFHFSSLCSRERLPSGFPQSHSAK